MQAKYETILVLSTNLDEEASTALVSRFTDLINANGTVESVESWGKRRLAYEINDLKEGYYVDLEFESDSNEALLEYDHVCNIKEAIIRHIVVKLPR